MWRNYLASALRNLSRNKLYTAVCLGGLCIGLAAALLIAVYVHQELTYDRWVPDYRRIYVVQSTLVRPGATPKSAGGFMTDSKLAATLKMEFPQIESIARLVPEQRGLKSSRLEAEEKIYWAEPDVFALLPLRLVNGADPAAALGKPDSIILSRAMARKYFGRDDPIGATLEIDRRITVRVTAIMEDLPSNTHLDTRFILSSRSSHSPFAKEDDVSPAMRQYGRGATMALTYLKLRPYSPIEALRAAMPEFRRRHPAPPDMSQIFLSFLNIADIHLDSATFGEMKPHASAGTLRTLSAVGLLIVLVAGFNFVNLMTARASRRSIEVGIRKVTGASRRDLIAQFIGESILYVALAMVLAIALAEAVLPAFNAFLDQNIDLDYTRPQFIAAVLGSNAVFGLLAGLYPAIVLSSFKPASVLKGGRVHAGRSAPLRQILVVMQFAVFTGMMVVTLVIFRQIAFARDQALHFDTDPVLLIDTTCTPAFKQEVAKLPGVLGAACSLAAPTSLANETTNFLTQRGEQISADLSSVDFGFFELYGVKPLAGRLFQSGRAMDVARQVGFDYTPSSVILNATAVRAFGLASPQAAIGQTINAINKKLPIIGVVPDMTVGSVRDRITPSVYFIAPSRFYLMSVKLSGAHVAETLQAIDAIWNRMAEKPRPITRRFLDEYVQSLYTEISRQATLLAAFAMVAAVIACLGLFGVSTFTAELRTKEVGIRKATGARDGSILVMLLWQLTRPVIWANVIAWPIAYYIMRRWLDGFAYRVDLEAWIFIAAASLALVIATLTVLTHALLVARAKPVEALRYE